METGELRDTEEELVKHHIITPVPSEESEQPVVEPVAQKIVEPSMKVGIPAQDYIEESSVQQIADSPELLEANEEISVQVGEQKIDEPNLKVGTSSQGDTEESIVQQNVVTPEPPEAEEQHNANVDVTKIEEPNVGVGTLEKGEAEENFVPITPDPVHTNEVNSSKQNVQDIYEPDVRVDLMEEYVTEEVITHPNQNIIVPSTSYDEESDDPDLDEKPVTKISVDFSKVPLISKSKFESQEAVTEVSTLNESGIPFEPKTPIHPSSDYFEEKKSPDSLSLKDKPPVEFALPFEDEDHTKKTVREVKINGTVQFLALVRKNFILKCRTPLMTFFEIFVPFAMVWILTAAFNATGVTEIDAVNY